MVAHRGTDRGVEPLLIALLREAKLDWSATMVGDVVRARSGAPVQLREKSKQIERSRGRRQLINLLTSNPPLSLIPDTIPIISSSYN
jgi:hypothetical protein